MAIDDGMMRAIERKAKAGQAMFGATPDKIEAYNKFAPGNSIYNQPAQPQQNQQSTPQYSFEMYNPNQHQASQSSLDSLSKNAFVQNTGNSNMYHFGNSVFDQNQLNEIAYYDDLRGNLLKQRHDLTMGEVGKGFGITEDFSKSTLAPLQQQYYEIEDYLLNKFGQFGGRGGTSDDFNLYGLNRNSLGMETYDANNFRVQDTADEHEAQQRLMQQGYSAQQAYEAVRRIDPNTAYSPDNPFSNNEPLSREALQSLLANFPNIAQQSGTSLTSNSKSSNAQVNEQQQLLAEAIERYLKSQKGAIQ